MNRMDSSNRSLFLSLSFLVFGTFAIRLVFWMSEAIDPFSFSTAGLAEYYQHQGAISPMPFEAGTGAWQEHANAISVRVLPSALLLSLSGVLDTGIQSLIFYPAIGIPFILVIYALARVVSKSNNLALVVAFVVALNPGISLATNNLFYIPVGLILMVSFFLVFLKSFGSNRVSFIVLMVVLFFSMYLSYYTAEFQAILFMVVVLLITRYHQWRSRISKGARLGSTYWSLTLAFVVAFIGFEGAMYHYAHSQSIGTAVAYLEGYFGYLRGILITGASAVHEFRGELADPVFVAIEFLYRLLLIVPVAVLLMSRFLSILRGDSRKQILAPGLIALILVPVGVVAIYLPLGLINLRSFLLFFPLVAIVAITLLCNRISRRRIRVALIAIFATALLVLSATMFVHFQYDRLQPYVPNQHTKMDSSVQWVVRYSGEGGVVSSQNIAGQVFLESIRSGRSEEVLAFAFGNDVAALYSENISSVTDMMSDRDYNVLLLHSSFETHAILAEGWLKSPPAVGIMERLNQSPELILVQSNGFASTFILRSS